MGNPAAVQRRPAAHRAEGRREDSGAGGPAQSAPSRAQAPPTLLLREPRTRAAPAHPQRRGRRTERGWRRGTGLRAPSARRTLTPASHQPRTHTAAGISPAAAQQEPVGRP